MTHANLVMMYQAAIRAVRAAWNQNQFPPGLHLLRSALVAPNMAGHPTFARGMREVGMVKLQQPNPVARFWLDERPESERRWVYGWISGDTWKEITQTASSTGVPAAVFDVLSKRSTLQQQWTEHENMHFALHIELVQEIDANGDKSFRVNRFGFLMSTLIHKITRACLMLAIRACH